MRTTPRNTRRACSAEAGMAELALVMTWPVWAIGLALALAALLGGCAPTYGGGPVIVAPAQPGPTQAQQDTIIDRAVARWAASGLPVYVGLAEEAPWPIQWVDGAQATAEACGHVGPVCGLPLTPAGPCVAPVNGCAVTSTEDGRPLRVVVRSDLRPGKQADVLTHELGHLLRQGGQPARRGEALHLDCSGDRPGPDVMCPSGGGTNQAPTARDVAFVCGAE